MILGRKIFDTLKESYSDENWETPSFSPVTHEEFIESVFDSVYYTESLFKDLNTQLCITEAEELAVIDVKSEDAVKKSIIETLKNLFIKFVNFLKSKMQQLIDWIKEMYMNTNAADSIVSKIGKGITFDRIKNAREKGWKGCPTTLPCVNPMSMSDSKINKKIKEQFKEKEYGDLCEKVIKCQTLQEAKEVFDDIKSKASETRSETRKRGNMGISLDNSWDVRFQGTIFGEEEVKIYVYTLNNANEKGYYYPDADSFAKVKTMAEKGESFIKNYNVDLNKYLNSVQKEMIDPEIANMKSFKLKGENATEDKEVNQINILYHKARILVAQLGLKAYSNSISDVIGFLKIQHIIAIKTYLYWIASTRKYVTEGVDLSAEEYLQLV